MQVAKAAKEKSEQNAKAAKKATNKIELEGREVEVARKKAQKFSEQELIKRLTLLK